MLFYVAHFLWCSFLENSGISWCMTMSVAMVVEAWRVVLFPGSGGVWSLILFAILWSVWLERNAKNFKTSSSAKEEVAHVVLVHIAKWASSKDEFNNIKSGRHYS